MKGYIEDISALQARVWNPSWGWGSAKIQKSSSVSDHNIQIFFIVIVCQFNAKLNNTQAYIILFSLIFRVLSAKSIKNRISFKYSITLIILDIK